jgi:hypothetical protein
LSANKIKPFSLPDQSENLEFFEDATLDKKTAKTTKSIQNVDKRGDEIQGKWSKGGN